MLNIGQINRLQVCDKRDEGVYLDGGESGPILLPPCEVAQTCESGQSLDVFVYHDAKARLVATADKPLAMVGQCAYLKIVSLTNVGAFLDWGLPKDLLLPFGEQRFDLQQGQRVLVRVFLDEQTQRVVATTRVDDFLEDESTDFSCGQAVELLITGDTQLGTKAIVDNSHWGVLYNNEVFQTLTRGQRIDGFIKKIRNDKKIDLSLYAPGYEKIAGVCEQIITVLKAHEGFIMITDKSAPEAIYSVFKVSKKVYKKAVGALYKQRRIVIEQQGIRLVEVDPPQ
ncbi:MAG: GntR family transcriptional regulator [Spongiibacteraceae bacterium]|nr:GntR family transcriptional regulator [Spongiibacteraceae bacterium]